MQQHHSVERRRIVDLRLDNEGVSGDRQEQDRFWALPDLAAVATLEMPDDLSKGA